MVKLIGYELKKMFKNPFFLIGMIFAIAFPLYTTIHSFSDPQEIHKDQAGNFISYETWIREQTKLEQSYHGSVSDPEWNAWIKEEHQKNRKNSLLYKINDEKMKEVYGEDWEEFWDDPKINQYYHLKYSEPNPYLQLESVTGRAYSLITTIENPPTGPFTEQQLAWIPYSELVYRRDVMKKVTDLTYGGHTNMDEFIRHSGGAALIVCLLYLILFPGIFNKEVNARMSSTIKTTKYGVKKVAYAKILTVVLISFVVSLLLFGSNFLLFHGMGGLPHFEVSYMVNESTNPFTYGQIYAMIFGLYLLCGLVIGSICCLLSSLFSSNYFSFALAIILFFFLLLVVSTKGYNFLAFHPFQFMGFGPDFFYNPLNIGSHSYDCVSTLFLVWIPLVIAFFGGSIWFDRKRIAS